MTMSLVTRNQWMLASSLILPSRCSGSSKMRARPSSAPRRAHVPVSWHSQIRAFSFALFVALVAFPGTVVAAPPSLRSDMYIELQARANSTSDSSSSSGSSSSSDGSISMNVWLPILLLTVVFALFSFCACMRRCAAGDAASRTNGANANGTTTGNAANAARPRRRPRRTPSQISTKSLPPYMKEPGDLELVLFRGPDEGEDDPTLPNGMPTLAEDDDEHPEMQGATYDVALDRIESIDTMADSSTTNLIRRASASVPVPPELHHATSIHGHRRSADAHSLDSIGSEAELLASHQRVISVDSYVDPRGAAPSYTEAVPAEGGMTTISLNDPQPNIISSNAVVPPTSADNVALAGNARSRFSFLRQNPFSSHNNADGASSNVHQATPSVPTESSAQHHARSGSALSRFSSRESHDSHHSRTQSNNSHSALCRAFRSHSPGAQAASSTISLDSISAPLTYTVKRAEFHAPKGGLLTPEQVKLITSREGLERFGVPYGADAIAAFSRERLPPPNFETVAGERQEQPDAAEDGETSGTTEAAAQQLDIPEPDSDATSPRSASLSPAPQGSVSSDARLGSSVSSYATAPESDEENRGLPAPAQTVQVYTSEDENETDEPDDPRTARPVTPITARPLSLSGSVSKRA